ncbi:MAG: hypothetical protein ACRCYU_12390 [Nocardioides sp.]
MSKNRVQAATFDDADWSFCEDAEAVEAVEWAARKAARLFEHVDYGDAQQDALLWLAVRPELHRRHAEAGNYRQLGQDVYAHALREPAAAESDRLAITDSLDIEDENDE